MSVVRFSVSLENELMDELDKYVVDNMFPNRSQAIRHLIENNLVEKKWKCNNIVAGAVVLIYDQNKTEIVNRLAEIKKQSSSEIISVQHFFITSEKSMEIIAVRGQSYKLTNLSDLLISIKGIEHGKLIMSKVE